MTTSRPKFLRLHVLILGSLLIFTSGLAGAWAQVAAPAPSQAQVIAQSVEPVSGGSMKWCIQMEAAPPAGQNSFAAANQFVYAESGQVLLTDTSGELQLLSAGQATYASEEMQVNANGKQPKDMLIVSLVAASAPDGGITAHPFDVEQGSYNLQFTRGVMNAGDRDTFYPFNDYPYLIVVTSGTVSLNDPGSTEVEDFPTGDVGEWTGVTEIFTDGEASYIIASIGEQVNAPSPTTATVARPPAATGTAQMMFYDCPESVLISQDPNECTIITYPVQAMLTLNTSSGALTRTTGMDAIEREDHWWVFDNLPTGSWTFDWIIGDASPPPQIMMSGDVMSQGNKWGVVVQPGIKSLVHVMLVPNAALADPDQGLDLNTLTVYFLECPSGWVVGDGLIDCMAAESPPNLELRDVMGAGIVLTTAWDAVSTSAGMFVLSQVSPQTYFISLEYNDYWTYENTYLMGSAYTDGLDWYVDVPADATSVEVYVVLGHIGDASNVTVPDVPDTAVPDTTVTGSGQVLITQKECLDMEGSGCVGAETPWEIYLISDATGEVYALSSEGTMIGEGQWLMFVPAGGYTVHLPDDAGWYVDYTGWIEVFDQTESYVSVTGYP